MNGRSGGTGRVDPLLSSTTDYHAYLRSKVSSTSAPRSSKGATVAGAIVSKPPTSASLKPSSTLRKDSSTGQTSQLQLSGAAKATTARSELRLMRSSRGRDADVDDDVSTPDYEQEALSPSSAEDRVAYSRLNRQLTTRWGLQDIFNGWVRLTKASHKYFDQADWHFGFYAKYRVFHMLKKLVKVGSLLSEVPSVTVMVIMVQNLHAARRIQRILQVSLRSFLKRIFVAWKRVARLFANERSGG
jgi:hypothetical protein